MATQLEINEVTALYEDILFRAPDSAGLTFWSGILDSGLLNLSQLINVFTSSPEALNNVDPIIRLYSGLLGRTADIPGLTGWVAAADSGTSFNTIVQDFVSSQEFANDYNGGALGPLPLANATAFVEALYFHFLNRAGDSAGVSGWVSVLTNNNTAITVASEAAVVQAFVNSPEYLNDIQNNVVAWVTAGAVSGLNNTTSTTVGTPTYPSSISGIVNSFTLTTGADHVSNVTNVYGDLTPFFFNGIGPTLNSDDVISGVTSFLITDDYAQGVDIIPAGAQLSNITNITLDTAGNAGQGSGSPFNTAPITAVQNLTVNSSGAGIDFVNAGSTTTITDTQSNTNSGAAAVKFTPAVTGAGVDATGGSNITITSFGGNKGGGGGVIVGTTTLGAVPLPGQTPTGTVTVTENGIATAGNAIVSILGGTQITVGLTVSSDAGTVSIGNTVANTGDSVLGGGTNPTGPITVTDAGIGGTINTFGGTAINITGTGDTIVIGDPGTALGGGKFVINAASNEPTGSITVSDMAPTPFNVLTSKGGSNVNVSAFGGTTVFINTNAGGAQVGTTDLNAAGTTLLTATEPTGNIVVLDSAFGAPAVTKGGSAIEVFAGANVNIVASGDSVQVGGLTASPLVLTAPTGAVGVSDLAATVFDDITDAVAANVTDIGGTNVTIVTNTGAVSVGGGGLTPLPGQNPSGVIAIVDTATGDNGSGLGGQTAPAIQAFGGTNVIISAVAGSIVVGAGSTASNPSGTVTINEAGVNTSLGQYGTAIQVFGAGSGSAVNVSTTGGSVSVGSNFAPPVNSTPVTGTVSITDTNSSSDVSTDTFSVLGGFAATGNAVTITSTATTGLTQVGVAEGLLALNKAGTAVANIALATSGNVSITNATTLPSGSMIFGTGQTNATTVNATSVSITGGGGGLIVDANSFASTAGPAVGTSTLASVSLTGVNGGVIIDSNAITTLTIANSSPFGLTDVDIVALPSFSALPAHALAVTLTNDSEVQVIDFTATSVSVTTSTDTPPDLLFLDAQKATSLTFNNSVALTVDDFGAEIMTTVTETGSGTLTLGNLTGDTALTSVTGAGTASGITVAISPLTTAFTGGTGVNIVTLDVPSAINTGQLVQAISGGGNAGSTVILTAPEAAYALPAHGTDPINTLANLGGFGVLGFGENGAITASGAYNVGTFTAETVGLIGAAIILDDLPATDAVAITSSEGVGDSITLEPNAPNSTINLTMGVDGTLGTNGLSTGNFEPVNNGNTSTLNVASVGDGVIGNLNIVGITDGTPDVTSMTISGDTALILGLPNTTDLTTFTVTDTANVRIVGSTLLDAPATDAAGGNTITFTGGAGQLTTIGANALTAVAGAGAQDVGGSIAGTTYAATTVTGTLEPGDALVGAGIASGTFIVKDLTGTGGAGTYQVSVAQTVLAETINAVPLGDVTENVNAGTGGLNYTFGFANTGNALGTNNGQGPTPPSGITGESGSENVFLANEKVASTLISPNAVDFNQTGAAVLYGVNPNVYSFHITTTQATSDEIGFATSKTVLSNAVFTTAVPFTGTFASYSVTDGIVTASAIGTPPLTQAQELSDVETLLNTAAVSNAVVMFTNTGSTFIVSTDTGVPTSLSDSVIALNGVSGVTGFGDTAAVGTIVSAFTAGGAGTPEILNRTNVGIASVTAAAQNQNDAGFSVATLGTVAVNSVQGTVTAALAGGTALANTDVTNFTNLAPSAGLVVDSAGGPHIGTVTTAQTGAAGSNSIGVFINAASAAVTFDSLTLTGVGQYGFDVTNGVGVADIVTSLTAATGTTLVAIGDANLSINSITDPTLTVVTGAATPTTVDTGGLSLGTALTPFSQAGLTVVGSIGGDNIVVSGAGDNISVGSDLLTNATGLGGLSGGSPAFNSIANVTDNNTVTATGANATISIFGGNQDFIFDNTATTNPLTIAGNAGVSNIGGTAGAVHSGIGTALPAGDIVDIGVNVATALSASATGFLELAATNTVDVWVGSGSTVNVTSSSLVDVFTDGDVTGALSSGTPAMTVIQAAVGSAALTVANITVDLFQTGLTGTQGLAGGAGHSLVNVAGVASLAAAEDLAASQALVLAQQFNGGAGTIVVGGVLLENAHTGLADSFQYGGNTYIVEAINNTSAAAPHTALGTGDVLVELIGVHGGPPAFSFVA